MNKDCNEGRQWKLLNGWMSRGRAAARTHGNQLEDSRLNKTVGRNNDNTNNRLSLNVARPQEPNNNRSPCASEGSTPSSRLQQPQQPQPQQRQRLICGTTRRVGREVNLVSQRREARDHKTNIHHDQSIGWYKTMAPMHQSTTLDLQQNLNATIHSSFWPQRQQHPMQQSKAGGS